jgi:potassium/hydrogen antiporter
LSKGSIVTVQQVVTVALVLILFDGGAGIGVRKLRTALAPVLTLGVFGTLITAAAIAALAHVLFGLAWQLAVLLGTALAPTDPAVVFSVLGNHEVGGRAGVIIEGESGANDPVGIALLVSLLAVGDNLGAGAVWIVVFTFVSQMAVGLVVGIAGGMLLVTAMQRMPLPSEGLYSLRPIAGAIAIYGVATVLHGSGFLAVFVAGILVGDISAPFKREIESVHSSLAALAEIVAFVVLGLTVSLHDVVTSRAWSIGLVLALLLALVVRPLVVGPMLLATRLSGGARIFVIWSGLKGAVPILLGTFVLAEGTSADILAYQVIFVVVLISVVVQGGLVPAAAARCGVPMLPVEPRPWSIGVRLRDEPNGVRRHRVVAGTEVDGRTVRELHHADDVWVSLVVRDGVSLRVRPDTKLRAGDEMLLLVDPSRLSDAPRWSRLPLARNRHHDAGARAP